MSNENHEPITESEVEKELWKKLWEQYQEHVDQDGLFTAANKIFQKVIIAYAADFTEIDYRGVKLPRVKFTKWLIDGGGPFSDEQIHSHFT